MNRLIPYANHLATCNVNNQQAWDEAATALSDLPPEVRADSEEMSRVAQAQADVAAKRLLCSCGFQQVMEQELSNGNTRTATTK